MAGGPRSPDARAPLGLTYSWPASFDSCRLEQLCQSLARIKHARLYGVLRNPDDLCDLFDRLFVIVDEIDDFPVFHRKSPQALPDRCALVLLLQDDLGIIRFILDCLGRF